METTVRAAEVTPLPKAPKRTVALLMDSISEVATRPKQEVIMGSIDVESEVEKGSRFTVHLPVVG